VVVGRRGGVHAFTPAKSAAYRTRCALFLRNEHCNRPALAGAVRVTLTVYRERPKSNGDEWPAVRPDIDNYAKQVIDALMDAGVLRDDGQVCGLHATKFWSRGKPGVDVTVETI
jgi:Holliday junction resolvase RusA-like endonuclease